jgi:hypothetical protein
MVKGGAGVAMRVGLPFVVLVCAGSLGLSQMMQTQFEIKDRKKGKSVNKRQYDIEEEHKRIMQKLNLDGEYSLSRIPRPDDEDEDSKK